MNNIKCPTCGTLIEIDVELQKQLQSDLEQKYASQYAEKEKALKKEKEKLENFKAKEKEIFENKLAEELKAKEEELNQKSVTQRKEYEEALRQKIQKENEEHNQLIQKELDEKSEQLKEFNKAKADIERLRREKDELREAIKLESEKELNERLKSESEKISQRLTEAKSLEIKELQKQLEDQTKLSEEMSRKLEQGSMQLQGEVQELAIEEWLAAEFPLDQIEEIKKGARGGDCIQTVNTRQETNCGKIYYESKRAKSFSNDWIEKFKNDMREKNISVGVLITSTMPKDMPKAGMMEGVWVCSYQEFGTVAKLLRDAIIRTHQISLSQENKADKMQLLYNYLTSDNFKLQLSSIVEAFEKMKTDLDKEKRAMQRLWKVRETQLDNVINNTIDMYGSLKGIAGNSIHTIQSLELDSGEDSPEIE